MKQLFKVKFPLLNKQLLFSILIACFIASVALWYDSSPVSFKNYQTICTSNYGKIEEFNACMKPFYNQQNMDHLGIALAIIIASISVIIFSFQHLKKAK